MAAGLVWPHRLWLALAAGLVLTWVALDLRNNLRCGRWNLFHTAARLPLTTAIAVYWPLAVVVVGVWMTVGAIRPSRRPPPG